MAKVGQTEFDFSLKKLGVKSIVMLCKSCRSSHKEINKMVVHFSEFSRIFSDFSKVRPKPRKL
jgi:hypothetical protein